MSKKTAVNYLYVLILHTKTDISKSFTILKEAFSAHVALMCRKSLSLGLAVPKSYTGRELSRPQSTLMANARGIIVIVTRYGGRKSTSVAQSYIEGSLSSKMSIAEKSMFYLVSAKL